MPNKGGSQYATAWTVSHVSVLTGILVVIAWLGMRPGEEAGRASTWFGVLGLMAAFAVITGHGITGLWRGILIDGRNRMSLSRLQMLSWTLVVLSALLTAALTNMSVPELGWSSPMNIDIPSQLWVVMGISTASLVGAPAILSTKRDRKPNPQELRQTVSELSKQGYKKVDRKVESVLMRNTDPRAASWGELLKGEESGNAANVDLGKLQMFFFTFILVVGYAAAIGAMFRDPGAIVGLPSVGDGMNTLLGISHTGYLANKAISHSREAEGGGALGGGGGGATGNGDDDGGGG